MKHKMKNFRWMMGLLLITPLAAQESVRTVILSPRIGAVIDVQEQERFDLFQHIHRFIRAVFYLDQDSAFHCIVTYQAGTTLKDTVIPYGKNTLLMIAEKINHYDELQEGSYTMGSDRAQLEIVGGPKIGHDPRLLQKTYNDVLPLAGEASVEENPVHFPCMSFGIGVSRYHPDFSGLNDAFNTVEGRYRRERYFISHVNPDIDVHTLFSVSLGVHFSNKSSLLMEATSVENFKSLSLQYLYRFAELSSWCKLLAGAGIGQYHFSGRVPYRQPIDDKYHYLDEITYRGGAIGCSILAGIEMGSLKNVRVSIVAKNLYVPPVETALPEGSVASVMLGSFMMEGKLEVTL